MKSTLIGGFLFLLPVGIIVIVLAKLVAYARRAGDALHERLFPGAAGDLLPTLLALAFAAGTLARTRLGLRSSRGWRDRSSHGSRPTRWCGRP